MFFCSNAACCSNCESVGWLDSLQAGWYCDLIYDHPCCLGPFCGIQLPVFQQGSDRILNWLIHSETLQRRDQRCVKELENHFWQFSMMRSCDITSKLSLLFYVQTKNKITSMNTHTVWKCCFCVPLQCLQKYYYKLILEKYFTFNTMNDNHLCSVSGLHHGSLALCEKTNKKT